MADDPRRRAGRSRRRRGTQFVPQTAELGRAGRRRLPEGLLHGAGDHRPDPVTLGRLKERPVAAPLPAPSPVCVPATGSSAPSSATSPAAPWSTRRPPRTAPASSLAVLQLAASAGGEVRLGAPDGPRLFPCLCRTPSPARHRDARRPSDFGGYHSPRLRVLPRRGRHRGCAGGRRRALSLRGSEDRRHRAPSRPLRRPAHVWRSTRRSRHSPPSGAASPRSRGATAWWSWRPTAPATSNASRLRQPRRPRRSRAPRVDPELAMCLVLLALAAHPRYAVVLAANRDEYHARPAAPAAWWGGRLARRTRPRRRRHLAGRDPRRPLGGHHQRTRAGPPRSPCAVAWRAGGALSRARLGRRPRDARDRAVGRAAQRLQPAGRRERPRALGFESRPGGPGARAGRLRPLQPAARHALAEGRADQGGLRRLVPAGAGQRGGRPRGLRDALRPHRGPGRELPATGIGVERERLLSAPFIVSPTYGTRCSTVLTIGYDGAAHFAERTFDPQGNATGDVELRFTAIGL